jgi:hypothetical protein
MVIILLRYNRKSHMIYTKEEINSNDLLLDEEVYNDSGDTEDYSDLWFGLTKYEYLAVWQYIRGEEININIHFNMPGKYLNKTKEWISSAINKLSGYNPQMDRLYAYIDFYVPEVWKAHAFRSTSIINHRDSPAIYSDYEDGDSYFSVINMIKKDTKGAYLNYWSTLEAEYLIDRGLTLKIIDFYRNYTGHGVIVFSDDITEDDEKNINLGGLVTEWGETELMINLVTLNDKSFLNCMDHVTIDDMMHKNRFGRPTFLYPAFRMDRTSVSKFYETLFNKFPNNVDTFINYVAPNGDTLMSILSSTVYTSVDEKRVLGLEPGSDNAKNLILKIRTSMIAPHLTIAKYMNRTVTNKELFPLIIRENSALGLKPNTVDEHGRTWLYYIEDPGVYNMTIEDLTHKDNYGNTPLLYRLIHNFMFSFEYVSKLEVRKYYSLETIEMENNIGNVPYTSFDTYEYLEWLIDIGMGDKLYKSDRNGFTPKQRLMMTKRSYGKTAVFRKMKL